MFSKVELQLGSDCWHWTAGVDDKGYGQVNVGGRPVKAHIVMWRLYRGAVPEGLTLDHLCRVITCVNPEHLEPVTRAENTRRQLGAIGHPNAAKTHCPNGHPYDSDNPRTLADGRHRVCRICRMKSNREYRARKRVAA